VSRPRNAAPAAPLSPLDAPCTKCGTEGPARLWIGADHFRSAQAQDQLAFLVDFGPWPSGEFQLSTCQACGFQWPAACLSSGLG